jgi:hypothetical protein
VLVIEHSIAIGEHAKHIRRKMSIAVARSSA